MGEQEERALLARRLRTQSRACLELGSPLYGELMEQAALDVEAGGILRRLLSGHEADPGPSALALRLFGALHRLALDGRAPALAAHFPSTGGDADAEASWPAVLDVVGDHFDELRELVGRGVQTNEVGRSAALLGGFLTAASESGLPLRILEIGSSAGLNLRWDRYHYRNGPWTWGDAGSVVQLVDYFAGVVPDPAEVTVAEREGCDASPVDATTDEGRLTLLSYVWPDQQARLDLLRGALDVASKVPAPVTRADAAGWLQERLALPVTGQATVVFHSVMWQYLSDAGRDGCLNTLAEAGVRASADAPLYRLRMEPANRSFEVRLTSWPGDRDRVLATCSAHGRDIHWSSGDV